MERLFRALADHTRVRLLNLMEGHDICVCYLVNITGESQPKISRHLAYLRRAGVVAAKREGKWMHYRIEAPKDIAGRRLLDAVFACLREDKTMQADRGRLTRACCKPEKIYRRAGRFIPYGAVFSHSKGMPLAMSTSPVRSKSLIFCCSNCFVLSIKRTIPGQRQDEEGYSSRRRLGLPAL